MKVALTGATGFTGRFVVEALARRGIDCVLLNADITNPQGIDAEVEATAFDRLIHLAAIAFVNKSDWHGFYAVNQIGTLNLLNAVARHRPGTRCIIASSAQVYGSNNHGLVEESAGINPTNHYAASKFAMELGARQWHDRLKITIARPFNYTGVGQSPEYLIPKIVDHFRLRAEFIELGNLFVQRDFGDVRSVADAYVGLVLADDPPPLVNISTGIVHSIDEILSCMVKISNHEIDVRVNPLFVRANDVPILGGSTKRLLSVIPEWSPRALPDTLAWMYTGA